MKISKIILCMSALMITLSAFSPVHAIERPYTVLAPLPGIGDVGDGTTTFSSYLPNAFNLTVAIAVVMAFVVITLGGITYAVSDSLTGKSQGRELVENAIYGLLLIIGAWVILNTINPQILSFTLTVPRPAIKAVPTVKAGVPMTEEEKKADTEIRKLLSPVSVPNGACTEGQTTGCTNVNSLPLNAVSGLKDLQKACGCEVAITGGTEGGHETHGAGAPIVDLRKGALDAYVLKNKTHMVKTSIGPQYTIRVNGRNILMLDEQRTGVAPHWHVVVQ